MFIRSDGVCLPEMLIGMENSRGRRVYIFDDGTIRSRNPEDEYYRIIGEIGLDAETLRAWKRARQTDGYKDIMC